jgi:hypothetical protein
MRGPDARPDARTTRLAEWGRCDHCGIIAP